MEKPYDDYDGQDYYYNQTEYDMGDTFYPNLLLLFCLSYSIIFTCKNCHGCLSNNNNDNDNNNRQPLIPDTSRIKKETVKFTEDMNDKECSICLEEFKNKEELTRIECSHYFHSECINDWFKSNGTCPLCRLNLLL